MNAAITEKKKNKLIGKLADTKEKVFSNNFSMVPQTCYQVVPYLSGLKEIILDQKRINQILEALEGVFLTLSCSIVISITRDL